MLKTFPILIIAISMLFGTTELSENPGLLFTGRVNDRPRTQLNLTPQKNLSLPQDFTIKFETSFQDDWTFGYLFNLTDEPGNQISLTNQSWSESDSIQFHLISNHQIKLITLKLPKSETNPKNWQNFSVSFFKSKNEIQFTIEENTQKIQFNSFSESNNYQLIFGREQRMGDVCHVAIRNIKILTEEEILHHWPLNDSQGETVSNIINPKYSGIQYWGEWQLEKHQIWSNPDTIQMDGLYRIYLEKSGSNFLFVGQNKFHIYELESHKLNSFNNNSNIPVNELIYFLNFEDSILYSQYRGRSNVMRYDFQNQTWSKLDSNTISRHYYGIRQFEDEDNHFYISGGYGFYKIKGHIQKYNFENNVWDTLNLKIEEPFFRNAIPNLSGVQDGKMYFAGGHGNDSGLQEYGYFQYKDLWRLDLNNLEMTKIWEDTTISDSLVIRKVQVNPDEKSAYFIFSKMIDLNQFEFYFYKLNIETKNLTLLMEIPNYPKQNFMFDENRQQIIQYYSVLDSIENTTQLIWSTLNWPPISNLENTKITTSIFYPLFFGILFIISLYFYYRKKYSNFYYCDQNDLPYSISDSQILRSTPYFVKLFDEVSIYKNGVNILGRRTMKQQNQRLLTYLITKTIEEKEGIEIQQFGLDFWGAAHSHRNSNRRSTLLSRVRNMLDKSDELPYILVNGYINFNWKSPNYNCDLELLRNCNELIQQNKKLKTEEINYLEALLPVFGEGNFAPNMQENWLEDELNWILELIFKYWIFLHSIFRKRTSNEKTKLLEMRILNLIETDIAKYEMVQKLCEKLNNNELSNFIKTEFETNNYSKI